MEMLNQIVTKIAMRKDLALVLLLMIIISVMILPLPTFLMDALIVVNMSLTILILMVSIYLHKAEDFSVFPTVILLATTFRLAISISTTRLILSQADAGAIIETFGIFVTQGSVVVGLVIFIIITTVQFIVVTKGSERVAEVAARFTLDAMPGRQMSIDAELRNGDITQAQASQKRMDLEKENKFFGAMDGSMKFVKGDAIAGIIIIIVNLAGGFGIGTISEGMSAGEAASVYSRLTVGDGLVSQIPALLLAICAGLVITRVVSKDQTDLGTEIASQLGGSSRTLIVAGVILAMLGFVPGFPIVLFLLVSTLFIVSGIFIYRKDKREQDQQSAQASIEDDSANAQSSSEDGQAVKPEDVQVNQNDIVRIGVGSELIASLNHSEFVNRRDSSLAKITQEFGQFPARFGFYQNDSLDPYGFEIIIEGVPVLSTKMQPKSALVVCEKQLLELLALPLNPPEAGWPIRSAYWVEDTDLNKLDDADAQIMSNTQIIVDVTIYYILKNAAQLFGFAQIEHILQLLKSEHPQLAGEVERQANVTQLLDIIRKLVDESVPIYSRRLFFEGLVDSISKTGGSVDMSEHIRHALRRQICQHFAGSDNYIAAYVIEPDLENRLRKMLKNEKDARFLAIDAQTSNSILAQIARITDAEAISVKPPLIVTSADIRPHLRAYLKKHNSDLNVLAFQEISDEFHLRPIGTISLVDSGVEGDKQDSSQAA